MLIVNSIGISADWNSGSLLDSFGTWLSDPQYALWLELPCYMMWEFWKMRNRLVFEGTAINLHWMSGVIIASFMEYNSGTVLSGGTRVTSDKQPGYRLAPPVLT